MSHYLLQVHARLWGALGIFDTYEVKVRAETEQEARRAAIQQMIDRGYETRGTSVLTQWA